MFSSVGKLFRKLFKKYMLLSDAEEEQKIFYLKVKKLMECNPTTENTILKKFFS